MERERRPGMSGEGIGGIVVGAAALLISVYTAYLEHRHAQAELWPHLELSTSDLGGGYKIAVTNKGTGPASIRDMQHRIDGHPVTTWSPWIDTLTGHHVPIGDFFKASITDATLSPGESVTLFSTEDHTVGAAVRDSHHEDETVLCYCSVFEDCWRLDTGYGGRHHRARTPVPVPKCPEPGPDSWVGIGDAENRAIERLFVSNGQEAGTGGDR